MDINHTFLKVFLISLNLFYVGMRGKIPSHVFQGSGFLKKISAAYSPIHIYK
jgi:hypothetical protein